MIYVVIARSINKHLGSYGKILNSQLSGPSKYEPLWRTAIAGIVLRSIIFLGTQS